MKKALAATLFCAIALLSGCSSSNEIKKEKTTQSIYPDSGYVADAVLGLTANKEATQLCRIKIPVEWKVSFSTAENGYLETLYDLEKYSNYQEILDSGALDNKKMVPCALTVSHPNKEGMSLTCGVYTISPLSFSLAQSVYPDGVSLHKDSEHEAYFYEDDSASTDVCSIAGLYKLNDKYGLKLEYSSSVNKSINAIASELYDAIEPVS